MKNDEMLTTDVIMTIVILIAKKVGLTVEELDKALDESCKIEKIREGIKHEVGRRI